jgi:hypothetical protein
VVVAESDWGRGILGVIDGQPPLGVEDEDDVEARKRLLREIGYKLCHPGKSRHTDGLSRMTAGLARRSVAASKRKEQACQEGNAR